MTTAHTVITTAPVDSYPWAVAVSANGSACVTGSVMLGRGVDRIRPGAGTRLFAGNLYRRYHDHRRAS